MVRGQGPGRALTSDVGRSRRPIPATGLAVRGPDHTPRVPEASHALPPPFQGPTMKLKRLTVLEKYKDIIDAFYLE